MTASSAALDHAGDVLHGHIGLRIEPSLRGRLARAVVDAANLAGQDVDSFIAALAGHPESLQSLCDRVTVQESGFFRHAEQFDVVARHLVPAISGPVHIWSAGCANGQEPYSLAMLLAELHVDGQVIATDVSAGAVLRTQAGRYDDRELGGLTAARQAVHGTRSGATWTAGPALRERVSASVRNLLDSTPPGVARCQIVFCRNVLIYFTPEHATAFLDHLADQLPVGAHLVLGSAESMWPISDRFETRRFGDTFVHRVRPNRPRATTEHRPSSRPFGVVAPPWPTPSRRRPPAVEARRRVDRLPPAARSTASELARAGLIAHALGDHVTAVRAFRQWTYLNPDDALAHFHLGLALESGGDAAAKARAFAVSRAVLQRNVHAASVEGFGGYGLPDVLRLLDPERAATP